MTDLRPAAQQALEALEYHQEQTRPIWRTTEAIEALKAALAEPVEPVAWGVFGANLHDMFFTEEEAHEMAMLKGDGSTVAPLYAAPPQRPAEPVNPTAWLNTEDGFCTLDSPVEGIDIMSQWVPLYASPPQRPAEPVGYLWPTGRHPEFRFTQQERDGVSGTPVYLSPPQRKPLTEEEISKVAAPFYGVQGFRVEAFARAIEAAHGIKEKT